MTIIITDYIAHRLITELTPAEQSQLIQSRKAAVLATRQAQAKLTTEQLIQAGENAARDLFG